jgi:ABC-type lipoprotein export system ATPase subunit
LESDAAKRDAMELFVNDSREKLRPLVEFASRVEPLLTNINSKFKNKSIRLDRDKGMVARAADQSEVRADQLSSGEQHEIVLLYFLLFRVSKNALVLIDEPELSLHIDWQRKFLPELLQIAAQAQIDALVATHSPSIVGDREDLMIVLDAKPD